MSGAPPPDPGEIRPIGPTDRRWMVAPIVLVLALAVAVVKPWGDRSERTQPAPPAVVDVPRNSPSAPSPATSIPLPRVIGTALPAAGDVVGAVELDAAPWANELAVDAEGAWVWADSGVVLRVGVATHALTRIDLGRPADDATRTFGSRGIAQAWSQIWVADPGHRGLARIDRETESVAERIELWPADDQEPSGSATTGSPPDRFASASGFAIDGDSIFVPSLAGAARDVTDPTAAAGALWRVDTASGWPPGWIPLDRPSGVAVGFGSVWVVTCCGAHSDAVTYSIVRLERETGGIQASIALPVAQGGADQRPVVRIGWDSVWVGLSDLPLVVRIDPATSSIRSTLPTELPVSDLAIGDDGSLWITESEPWYRSGAVLPDRCEGRLVRVDTSLERPVAATTVACPMSVAVQGNDVWVGSAGTEPRSTGYLPPRIVHMRVIDPPG